MIIRSLYLLCLLSLVSLAISQSDCGLYLAETLDQDGSHTLGVFAGKSMSAGNLVGTPDIVVPLIDFLETSSKILWDSVDVGGVGEGYFVKSASLGLGSLTRGDPLNGNVMVFQSRFDDAGLHRSRDPGAGAISYYHGAAIISTQDIAAGQELKFRHDHSHNQQWLPNQESVYNGDSSVTMDDPNAYLFSNAGMLNPSNSINNKLVMPLQEKSGSVHGSIQRLLSKGFSRMGLTSRHPHQQDRLTPEWLAANGTCIDNLIQGHSHIDQAGRGAFTSRSLKTGSVIAPAPIVLLDKQSLEIEDEQPQLMMNYCFSHPQSSKVVCPVGPGTAFINHSPNPNAMIRWKNSTTRILEYVALRDIEKHEEVTINYGLAWEKEWKSHLSRWEPDDENYISAQDMNAAKLDIIRTHREQLNQPYPESVTTSCYYEWVDEGKDSYTTKQHKGNEYKVKTYQQKQREVPEYLFLRPCRILERQEHSADNLRYVVEMMNDDNLADAQQIPFSLVVTGVPREAITFQDLSYSTDMHLPWAFRQTMMMDDILFPGEWKDLQ